VNRFSSVVKARRIHVWRTKQQAPTTLMLKPAANSIVIKFEGQGVCTPAGQAAAFIPARLGQPDLPAQFDCSRL
jgi:hypothetical protein